MPIVPNSQAASLLVPRHLHTKRTCVHFGNTNCVLKQPITLQTYQT